MKKILLAFSILLISYPFAYSQFAGPCSQASPLCAQTGLSFTNSTNVAGYGAINCMYSSPNPTWYYLEVGTGGDINLALNQTNNNGANTDVDFMLWGPFTSSSAGCASIQNDETNADADCSYEGSVLFPESVNISNGQPGSVYILLITNYANTPGTITLVQTSGGGATNCGILSTAQNDGPICVGEPLTLTSTSSSSSGSVSTTWYLASDLTTPIGSGTPFTFTPPAAGTFEFALIVMDINTFESDTSYTTAVVNPIPALPTFTSTAPACEGSSVTLTPDLIIPGASYQWSSTAGYTSNQVTPTFVNAIPAFSSTYSLVVTVNGCTSPPYSQPLLIYDTDVPLVSGPTEVCEGNTVQLDVTNGNLFQSFSWNGTTGTGDPQSVPAGSFTVSATDGNGCVTTSAAYVVSVIPNVLDIIGDTAFCEGTPITLSATAGKQSYAWSTGSSAETTEVFEDGLVTVTVVSQDGCTRSDSAYIKMHDKPVASFTPGKVCDGQTVTFNNTSSVYDTYGSVENNWFWNFGHNTDTTNTPATSFSEEPSHEFPNYGTYNIIFQVGTNYGCKDTIEYPFVVIESAHPNFTFESFCFGEGKFTNTTIMGTYPLASAIWSFGDGSPDENTTDAEFYHSYPSVATYSVSLTLTDTANCISDTTIDITLKVTPMFDDIPNIITPNGDNVNDDYTFLPEVGECYNYTFAVFNRWGAKVYETEAADKKFDGKSMLGSKLQDGTYYWVLIANAVGQGQEEQIVRKGSITIAGTK